MYDPSLLKGEFFANQVLVLNTVVDSSPTLIGAATYTALRIDAIHTFGHLYRSKTYGCAGGVCN